jgi:hypothetical protein
MINCIVTNIQKMYLIDLVLIKYCFSLYKLLNLIDKASKDVHILMFKLFYEKT